MAGFDDLLSDLDGAGAKDPMKSASQSMKQNFPKRFYNSVEVAPGDQDFQITLDERTVKTPGRALLALPTLSSAELVAGEWRAQEKVIDPTTMPGTRLANTAIDGIKSDPQAVRDDIVRFATSDLICYRAESPQGLVELQNTHWDRVLDWSQATLGARFVLAAGVIHVAQPAETISSFGDHVAKIDCPFTLAALHSITSLTGSALLAIGVYLNEHTAEQAWAAAHVDEDWQISQWGEDFEAKARRETRWQEMRAMGEMLKALA